jgi:succinate dehydrogenase/fumarate reductase flavoprotein subunit
MAKRKSLGHVIESDVLVIGGGASGLWTAIKAREFVNKVLLVDKGPRDYGGLAARAGGDFDAVLPLENVDNFVRELVYYFDGLCDQDIVEELFKQSTHRMADYERLGHKFVREPDGKLKGIPQRGLDHIKCYIYRPYGEGGRSMVRVLVQEAKRLDIKRLGRVMIADLLKNNDAVVGATGFDILNGDFYIFKSKAVVMATGQAGFLGSTSTGEGMDMALKAGAELKNCEFARVWVVPRLFAWEGQTALLPLGARFINGNGDTFMEKYSPALGNNTDPHYNVLGMAIEAKEGRGPFYLDCSGMKPQNVELMKPGAGWQKLNYERLKGLGIDFFKDKTEWMPHLMASYEGIDVDLKGCTKVPGLFMAGVTWPVDPGLYMGGWNLCKTAVTGYMVGESAGKYAQSHTGSSIAGNDIEALKNKLFGILGKEGISPRELLLQIQKIIFPYQVSILKSQKSLADALHKIEGLKKDMLPQLAAKDAHNLANIIEVRSTLNTTERYLRASLLRTESRAGHFREDYPRRDDQNWMKWIVVSEKNSEFQYRTEPVPIDRYKFKPTRYYMDNFKF